MRTIKLGLKCSNNPTIEVHPDSPRATPEQCNAAQVAAVCAGIDYALVHR
ncbi:hypothetical protein HNR62_000434 [Oceanisphaera litoralis]|nr:hypothetical protein [Oceanisphaera litoralis]MBM7454605.1 hypothetical protein [Oceanisphaera litoralis]